MFGEMVVCRRAYVEARSESLHIAYMTCTGSATASLVGKGGYTRRRCAANPRHRKLKQRDQGHKGTEEREDIIRAAALMVDRERHKPVSIKKS